MTHDDAISLYTPIHARGESIIAKCVMWRHASCRQRFLFEAAYIVCFWRWSGHRGTNGRRALWARNRHDIYELGFDSDFAISRAPLMKSCATGLRVRFFRVTIPLTAFAPGNSTGRIIICERFVGSLKEEAEKTVR